MLNFANFTKAKNILLHEIKKHDVDALVINSFQNRFWLLNFASSDGYVILTKNKKIVFFIDGRYFKSAQNQLKQFVDVVLYKNFDDLKNYFEQNEINSILLEDIYVNIISFKQFEKIVSNIQIFSAAGVRVLKNESEIYTLIKAADIAVETTNFIFEYATPGKSEKEIALAATIKMLELGSEKNSFDLIVASGENGANPHHRPSDRVLQENEMVTLDLGCVYNNFCSDMTRTWAVANTKLPEILQNLHNIVYEAQNLGLKACVNTNTTLTVDAACRRYIKQLGHGDYFVHSTGHGVGIDVHELPIISALEIYNKPLINNMVITVEPGIYVPNFAGVRIEDTVVINGLNPLILNDKAIKKTNW